MTLNTSFALSFQGRRCLSPDQHMLTQTQHSSGQLPVTFHFLNLSQHVNRFKVNKSSDRGCSKLQLI